MAESFVCPSVITNRKVKIYIWLYITFQIFWDLTQCHTIRTRFGVNFCPHFHHTESEGTFIPNTGNNFRSECDDVTELRNTNPFAD